MRVPGLDSVAMIDDHQPAVAARDPLCVLHYSIRGGSHGCSLDGRNVDAGMKRAFARKWVLPVAEVAHQSAVHRPDRRHGVLLPGASVSVLDAGETGGLQPVVFVDRFTEGWNQQALV